MIIRCNYQTPIGAGQTYFLLISFVLAGNCHSNILKWKFMRSHLDRLLLLQRSVDAQNKHRAYAIYMPVRCIHEHDRETMLVHIQAKMEETRITVWLLMGSKSNVDFLMALRSFLLALEKLPIFKCQSDSKHWTIERMTFRHHTNATIQLGKRNNLLGFEAVNHLVNISMKMWKKRA